MFWRRFSTLTLGAALCATALSQEVASTREVKLTLDQALAIAKKQNPYVLAAKLQAVASRENLSAQRAPVNPYFSVSGLNNSVASDLTTSSSYSLMFTVETNGAPRARTSQARNQYQAALADAESAWQSVGQSVVDAYVELQVANAALVHEQEAFDASKQLKELTDKQFAVGAVPETNTLRADVALAQEQANLLAATGRVRDARSNLNVRLGRRADDPIDVADQLKFSPLEYDLARLHSIAEANRTELKSAKYTLGASNDLVGLQRSQYYPNLQLGTDFSLLPAGQFYIGLTFPLFDFGGIRGSVRQARALAQAQAAVVDQVRQSISLDVESAHSAVQRTQKTVLAYQRGTVPRAELLVDKIRRGYTLGANTILDLIDAMSTLRSINNDYTNAIGDHLHAIAQLEHAIGGRLPASGGQTK